MSEITLVAETPLQTDFGLFYLFVFEETGTAKHHYALTFGDVKNATNAIVRIQSSCFTSEIFRANNCDCRQQIDRSLQLIAQNDCGLFIHLDQDGRGNGVVAKIRALELVMKNHMDTHDAYVAIGIPVDNRDFGIAAEIMKRVGIKSPVRMVTNNPNKLSDLEKVGIAVSERISLYIEPLNEYARIEQETKERKLGHLKKG